MLSGAFWYMLLFIVTLILVITLLMGQEHCVLRNNYQVWCASELCIYSYICLKYKALQGLLEAS